jgi:hypothetical protein
VCRDLVALGMRRVAVRAWGPATVAFVTLGGCGGKAVESPPSAQGQAGGATAIVDAGQPTTEQPDAQADAATQQPEAGADTCELPLTASMLDAGSGEGCSVQAVGVVNGAPPCPSGLPYFTMRCIGVDSLQPDPSLLCKPIAHSYPAGVLDWCCPCEIHIHIK